MKHKSMDKKFNLFTLIILGITLSITLFALTQKPERSVPLQLDGKYITNDSEAFYTFSGDSLFVDAVGSGCGINQFKLSYQGDGEYQATDMHGGNVYLRVKMLRHDTLCILWGSKDILDSDTLRRYRNVP